MFLPKSPMDRRAGWATVHGVTESEMTEQLTHTFSFIKYLLSWACLVAQIVKNLPAKQEARVQYLVGKIP